MEIKLLEVKLKKMIDNKKIVNLTQMEEYLYSKNKILSPIDFNVYDTTGAPYLSSYKIEDKVYNKDGVSYSISSYIEEGKKIYIYGHNYDCYDGIFVTNNIEKIEELYFETIDDWKWEWEPEDDFEDYGLSDEDIIERMTTYPGSKIF